jgi:redox-sensitive bicupin YhaK (pirin superfamily)
MLKKLPKENMGKSNLGWLESRFHFSFAEYRNPNNMNFGVLRVLNDDIVHPMSGFDTHPHANMEIISYVIDGALEHKDSMGTETVIRTGDVQRMSAGTGIRHSEYNHSKTQQTHFLQIWIMPEKLGVSPSYDQKSFTEALSGNGLILVASKTGREGSISINQDVDLYACKSNGAGEKTLSNKSARRLWIQNIKGDVLVNDQLYKAGDAAGFEKTESLHLKWSQGSEFLVFDLP